MNGVILATLTLLGQTMVCNGNSCQMQRPAYSQVAVNSSQVAYTTNYSQTAYTVNYSQPTYSQQPSCPQQTAQRGGCRIFGRFRSRSTGCQQSSGYSYSQSSYSQNSGYSYSQSSYTQGGHAGGFIGWLNSVRASHGLGAVGYDSTLESWASQNNAHQASRGLGHYVMGPARRQNSAMSSGDPGNLWMNSPAHRAALLDPTITRIGIASNGSYWTFNAN